jgi:small subunit ribosomal protein S2
MKQLLEAGVHFGHRTQRWHPKMKPYLFTERNGIHIIDLQQTLSQIELAHQRTQSIVASGGTVLFVGTKKQAQQTIAEQAGLCSMPYVNHRWLGGTLTNFRTIRQRVDYMINLEQQRERGDFDRLPKKEALSKNRLIEKLNRRLGGLREMRRLPELVFIVDVRREDIAVAECEKLGIPIMAMVDTNANPDPIDLVIPANDDAIRAIRLITGTISQACLDGQHMQEVIAAEEEEVYRVQTEDEIQEPETFLGPSTLAKIRSGIGGIGEEGEEVSREAMRQAREPVAKDEPDLEAVAEDVPDLEPVAEDEPDLDVEDEGEGDLDVEDEAFMEVDLDMADEDED